MSTYDPNDRYRPVEANDSGYGGWVIGGLIAIAIVIGLIFWGASGNNGNQTANAPAAQSETTGMGSPSVPARPSAPHTPAPPAPVGNVR